MSRVAICPQCQHELLVPNEAESESWAKCPECRVVFQINQAAPREVLMAQLVGAGGRQPVELHPHTVEESTMAAQDVLETVVVERPPIGRDTAATQADDVELEDSTETPKGSEIHTLASESSEIEDQAPAPSTFESGTTDDDADLEHNLLDQPNKGDDLEAAAQRIDEWFRSAKTLPDAPPVGATSDPSSVDETSGDEPTSGPSQTNATLDMDNSDADDFAALADFDLDEPEGAPAEMTLSDDKPAWDDAEQLDDLLSDEDSFSAKEFAAEFDDSDDARSFAPKIGHGEEALETLQEAGRDEQPVISLIADGDKGSESSKRRVGLRQRSLARSLMLIVAAGLFGSAAGYYALLWLRGPDIDFLNVAQYLPQTVLPSSFQEPRQIVRNEPQLPAADTAASAEPTTTDERTDLDPSEESAAPQELPLATDETAEPMPDATAVADAAPAVAAADASEQSTEVQAGYSETEPADAAASDPLVGDRYATAAGESQASAPTDSTAASVTSEKPATTDLSIEDLAPADAAAPVTEDPAANADLTATTEPAVTDVSGTEATNSEPAALEPVAADPLLSPTEAVTTGSAEVKIAGAPSFTADDLRVALDAATQAQPQLVEGDFTDGKQVQRAKGAGFSLLADLAQKATFVEAADEDVAEVERRAEELFRKTLADAHTRGDVAQILPLWIGSKNRKHGGVFFAGTPAGPIAAQGAVVQCDIALDGGKTLTILTPPNAGATLDATKPVGIVGWLVDKPSEQIEGYTGSAQQAVFAGKLIPLE